MSNFQRFLPYYRYLKPVWFKFALGILFGVLFSVSSGLGIPLMAKTVFPVLFGNSDEAPGWLQELVFRWFPGDQTGGFLILCCLFLPLVMFLRAAGQVGNGYFMTYSGMFVVQAISRSVFEKIQVLPLAFFQKNTTGQIMAAVNGYPMQLKAVVVDTSNDLVKQPLTLISAVGFLIYESFTSESFFVAMIAIGSVPLVVFPILRIGKYLAKRSTQLVALGEALSSSSIETVQSPLEIRAYNLQSRQNLSYSEQLKGIFIATMKSVRAGLIVSPLVEVVSAVGLAISLYVGVKAGMNQGQFMALAAALYMAYTPIKRLGAIHGMLRTLEAPLDRLEAILEAPEELADHADARDFPTPATGRIEFDHVGFKYENGDSEGALRNVSVTIPSGKTVGLVGRSGAGKSTFVNLIPRFYEVSSGQLLVDGVDVSQLRAHDLRQQIAYVPQMPILFNASVSDNIKVGKEDATDDEIREVAKKANAFEFIEDLPQGFDTILSERGNSLSGGQRQRIAIARAFLKNAPILILDEATSALDNQSDKFISEAVDRLSAGRTTLIIAHRMSSLKGVSRRLYFEDGSIKGDGTHEELVETCEGYANLCRGYEG